MSKLTDNNASKKPSLSDQNTRKKLAISLIAATIVSAASLPAAASKYRNYDDSDYQNSSYNSSSRNSSYDSSGQNSSYDYAKVINVNPRIETYQVNKPVEQCWDERVPTSSRDYRSRAKSKTKTPEIVGAIIGGIIGNQVGKRGGGKARDVATVAGAVLGGSIGHDTKRRSGRYGDRYDNRRNDRYERARYETVQRCEIKDSYITEQQVVGYDVEYKYRGNVFYTQMPERPGKKIRVKVTVNPA